MKTPLIIHGAWAAAAIASFVLGSQMFPASDGPSGIAARNGGPGSKSERPSTRNGGGGDTNRTDSKQRGRSTRAGERSPATVLTDEDIASLGEKIRNSSNPIDRRLAFSRLLENLTTENALLMREQIVHMSAESAEFKEFHYAWGAITGASAVLNGAETPKPDMAPALAGWASANPGAAVEWYQNLDMENDPGISQLLADNNIPAEELRKHLTIGMVHGLSDADPLAASDFVIGLAATGDGKANWMMGIVTGKMLHTNGPSETGSWAQDLPAGEMRAGAIDKVAHNYANQDPAATVEWLESIPATEDKSRGLRAAFSTWAHKDPEPAAAHINQMAPSKERDQAISGYAPSVAHKDPTTAIQLADTIDDPGVREQALIRSSQVYYHRVDKEAAAEWLPDSGLSPEAQQKVIHPRRR